MQAENKFSYSVQPHAAPVKQRPKYRNETPDGVEAQNIMFDNRVVRGNTYSAKVLSSALKNDLNNNSPGSRRNIPRKDRARGYGSGIKRSSTPPPMDGRSHMIMQTEDFLEELTDRPIEQDAETQTTNAMDRPASPLFVRAKIGFDVTTQIEPGDLFDFDLEVQPILEVLVGKTLHVAMLEVMQEEELEAIRLQQEEYETIRNIELAEVQRLEAEIKRKEQEKARRVAQEKKRLEDRRKLEESIAARQFSQQFLGELHLSVFDLLEEQGHFYDPVQREIEELFLDDLVQGVTKGAELYEIASQMAEELLKEASVKAKAFEKECIQAREAWREKVKREEQEAKKREEQEKLAREAAKKAEEEAALAAENAGNNPPAED